MVTSSFQAKVNASLKIPYSNSGTGTDMMNRVITIPSDSSSVKSSKSSPSRLGSIKAYKTKEEVSQSQSSISSQGNDGVIDQMSKHAKKILLMRQKGSLMESEKGKRNPRYTFELDRKRSISSERIIQSIALQGSSNLVAMRKKKNTRPTKQLNSINARRDRLYAVSTKKQEEGRKRREAIALKSKARNAVPNPEDFGKISIADAQNIYKKGVKIIRDKESRVIEHERKKREQDARLRHVGTIPMSQADQMYHKGQKTLRQKNIRIAKRIEKKCKEEIAMHEFKLAEGAFALSLDDKFKKETRAQFPSNLKSHSISNIRSILRNGNKSQPFCPEVSKDDETTVGEEFEDLSTASNETIADSKQTQQEAMTSSPDRSSCQDEEHFQKAKHSKIASIKNTSPSKFRPALTSSGSTDSTSSTDTIYPIDDSPLSTNDISPSKYTHEFAASGSTDSTASICPSSESSDN